MTVLWIVPTALALAAAIHIVCQRMAAGVMGTIECAVGLGGTQDDTPVKANTRVESFESVEAATAALRTSRASGAAV